MIQHTQKGCFLCEMVLNPATGNRAGSKGLVDLVSVYALNRAPNESKGKNRYDSLGHALRHCRDLAALQANELTQLPAVAKRASREKNGLKLGKALRKELIACVEQITYRRKHPIKEITWAIDKAKYGLEGQDLDKMQKNLGIPFPRSKLDLARYYSIRLVMEGMNNQLVADFLQVDPRTVGNYIAQAMDHIRLILEINY